MEQELADLVDAILGIGTSDGEKATPEKLAKMAEENKIELQKRGWEWD